VFNKCFNGNVYANMFYYAFFFSFTKKCFNFTSLTTLKYLVFLKKNIVVGLSLYIFSGLTIFLTILDLESSTTH